MELINRYFPELNDVQREQLTMMMSLYTEWNEKINVISRKDIHNIETNHILHSLAIARFVKFKAGTKIMDLGTGGGLPGLPLAVYFPEVEFLLVDRIAKKLKVAADISQKLKLKNVTFVHGDAGEVKGTFDFVVSRAVMQLPNLEKIVRKFIARNQQNAIPNGLLCLKGGDLTQELAGYKNKVYTEDISLFFKEEFFETKKIVYLPL